MSAVGASAEYPRPELFPGHSFELDYGQEALIVPQVTLGAAYQEFLPDFTVDVSVIVDHLREGGLSDEDITDTSIHFFDEPNISPAGVITHGSYNRFKRSVSIYPEASLEKIAEQKRSYGYDVCRDMNINLAHELEHRRVRFNPGIKRQNMFQHVREAVKVVEGLTASAVFSYAASELLVAAGVEQDTSSNIGWAAFALTGVVFMCNKSFGPAAYKTYLRNPEERHCRAFEETDLPRFIYMADSDSTK
ncbi:MAG: hypothetical protein ABWX94_00695 [Candidatus Saccharimonadales bacterium]